jgi:hypothetical protein
MTWLGQQPAAKPATAPSSSLDFNVFKTQVEPIFLTKRPGHARCVSCYSTGTPMRLQAVLCQNPIRQRDRWRFTRFPIAPAGDRRQHRVTFATADPIRRSSAPPVECCRGTTQAAPRDPVPEQRQPCLRRRSGSRHAVPAPDTIARTTSRDARARRPRMEEARWQTKI